MEIESNGRGKVAVFPVLASARRRRRNRRGGPIVASGKGMRLHPVLPQQRGTLPRIPARFVLRFSHVDLSCPAEIARGEAVDGAEDAVELGERLEAGGEES